MPRILRQPAYCSKSLTVLLANVLLLVPAVALAGSILDYLRSYDLNDYALGLNVSISQNPYTNANNSVIAYPYLTSFQHASLTDDWLLIADGDLGVRKVTSGGWVFGAVGRMQTLGLGSERPDELIGLNDKQWAIEIAPLVAYRGWPVHITAKTYKEISGRHGGWISELRLEKPFKRPWGYIVPSIKAAWLDETYANYYYQVTLPEARQGRPVYSPGATMNLAAELSLGYQITEKWLLSGNISYEKLGTAIRNSPIVERDRLWSAGLGIAYNANIFRAREFGADAYKMPRFEFRAALFYDNISTKVVLDALDGSPGDEIDLEDSLGVQDSKSVLQLDAIVRLTSFHRLEFGHFSFSRDSALTLRNDVEFGDEIFPAGTDTSLRTDLRVTRLSYAFSLMHDAQKELGVMAGVHLSRLETEVFAPDTGQKQTSTVSTPLPVIGVHGRVALGSRTFLGARIQIFRMQFDQYKGSMNYVNLGLQHMLGQKVSLGIGYNYYDLKLDSDQGAINGKLEIRHQGPFLFLGAHF